MTTALWTLQVGDWLMQGAAALPDTIFTKQVAEEPSTFTTIAGIARGLMTIAILVLTVALVPAAWNFRKSYKKVNDLLDRVYGDINPLVRHLSAIADNVDYITTSIRTDVQQVNRTVAEANQRLNHALALSEQRLNEFNALLQVVQREAEGAFVSAASTLRGVRAGASTFRREALDPGVPWDDDFDEEELDDGDHADATGARTPGPRIRPRPRGDLA